MQSIIYVGMDVHTENFTFASYEFGKGDVFAVDQVIGATWKDAIKYMKTLQKQRPQEDIHFVCGYEAGCFGYSLYNELMAAATDEKNLSLQCVIMAPSTMAIQGNRKKTDRRDARMIATNLAHGTYSSVYVVSKEDNGVRDYIRMRDDTKKKIRSTKQQINALCLRHGKNYTANKWTVKHYDWLHKVVLEDMYSNITLREYLHQLSQLEENLVRYDKEIEEIATRDRYAKAVEKLCCLKGINTITALSLVTEIGDFNRFSSADKFAAFLGLVPGEYSSGGSINRTGITKHGNTYLRRLITESAQGYSKGTPYTKSWRLKARQSGQEKEIVDYCDRARIYLGKKYFRLKQNGKNGNVCKTAVARGLACFVWGLMTDNIS